MGAGQWLARGLLLLCLGLAPPSGYVVAGRRGAELAGHTDQLGTPERRNVLQYREQLAAQVGVGAATLQPPAALAGQAAAQGTSQLGSVSDAGLQAATAVAEGINMELSRGGQFRSRPPPAPLPPAAPPPPKELPNFESTPMPQPLSIEDWSPAGSPLEMSSATFLSKGEPPTLYTASLPIH